MLASLSQSKGTSRVYNKRNMQGGGNTNTSDPFAVECSTGVAPSCDQAPAPDVFSPFAVGPFPPAPSAIPTPSSAPAAVSSDVSVAAVQAETNQEFETRTVHAQDIFKDPDFLEVCGDKESAPHLILAV